MNAVETATDASAPVLTFLRKRKRERTAFGADVFHHLASLPGIRRDPINPAPRQVELPLPLAGEGWGGGIATPEVSMDERKTPAWKVSSRLHSNARALRKNSTNAERILWSALRYHRLNGASFRRQVPIATYIADFVCHAAKLVIELDGGQHFSPAQEAADARRSAIIKAKGFRVLRFNNHDVMTNRVGVLETIATAIGASTPTLTLPRKREREGDGLERNRSS